MAQLQYPVLFKTSDVRAEPIIQKAVAAAVADAEQLWAPEKFDGVFPVKGFGIKKLDMYDLDKGVLAGAPAGYSNTWLISITTARTWTLVFTSILTDTTYVILTGFFNYDADPDVTGMQIVADGVDYPVMNLEEAYGWDEATAYFGHPVIVRPEKKVNIYVKARSAGQNRFGFLGYAVAKRSYLISRIS